MGSSSCTKTYLRLPPSSALSLITASPVVPLPAKKSRIISSSKELDTFNKTLIKSGVFGFENILNPNKSLIYFVPFDCIFSISVLNIFLEQRVMRLNAEDGGNRKYVLVQLDEPIKKKNNKEAYDFVELKKEPILKFLEQTQQEKPQELAQEKSTLDR